MRAAGAVRMAARRAASSSNRLPSKVGRVSAPVSSTSSSVGVGSLKGPGVGSAASAPPAPPPRASAASTPPDVSISTADGGGTVAGTRLITNSDSGM